MDYRLKVHLSRPPGGWVIESSSPSTIICIRRMIKSSRVSFVGDVVGHVVALIPCTARCAYETEAMLATCGQVTFYFYKVHYSFT